MNNYYSGYNPYGYGLNNNYNGYSPFGYGNLGYYNYPGYLGNNYLNNGYGSYSPFGLNYLNNNFLGNPLLTSVPQVLPGLRKRTVY